MIGKIALLAVTLMLLTATVAFAGPRMAELDNNPNPSDLVLTEAAVPEFTLTSVWPGTIADDGAPVKVFASTIVWPGTIEDYEGRDNPGSF